MKQTGSKVAFVALMAVAFIAVFGLIGFAFGWFNKAAEVVGPDNVSKQHYQVIEKFNSVQQAANTACQASKVKKEEGDPLFLESPEIAYASTVRTQVTDYNRRQANLFEAKIAGPANYPKELPIPASNEDWCSYSDKIAELRN